AEEAHVQAQIAAARSAELARQTGSAGIECGAGSEWDVDAVARLDHGSGDFVTERQGLAQSEVADGTAVKVVQIGAADAAVSDRDPDLAGRKRRICDRLDPQILRSVTNRRQHSKLQNAVASTITEGSVDRSGGAGLLQLFGLAGRAALVTGASRG